MRIYYLFTYYQYVTLLLFTVYYYFYCYLLAFAFIVTYCILEACKMIFMQRLLLYRKLKSVGYTMD